MTHRAFHASTPVSRSRAVVIDRMWKRYHERPYELAACCAGGRGGSSVGSRRRVCRRGAGGDAGRGRLPATPGLAADGVTPFINPLAPKKPHFQPKAKSVIFLYMYGGPSHIDTFDYKPGMKGMDGKTIQVKTFGRGGHKNEGRIVEPKWNFKQYGQCGKWVSDLFPHLATLRGRHRLHPLHDRRLAHPRLGDAPDEHRQDPERQPLPRLLGQLRPGHREPEPARLRGDARPARRADQRRQELVQRLHARLLPGDRDERAGATPILDLRPPGGQSDAHAAARCSTRCSEYNARARAAARRQLQPGGAHRQLRAGVPDAVHRAGSHRPEPGSRSTSRSCTAWTTSAPRSSAGSA